MTWRALITSSLRLIGQLGPGRGAGPSETADALTVLNAMLAAWNIQRLAVYTIARNVYTLTGAQDYTIGTGEDFDTPRPNKIAAAGYVSGDSETAITVYRRTARADRAGLYYDFGFPTATIHLEPAPASGDTLAIYTWQPLGSVADADLDEAIEFPDGYADAIRYNLALRLAPEWSRAPRPDVQRFAAEALAVIKAHNRPSLEMKTDAALLAPASFDIYRGDR